MFKQRCINYFHVQYHLTSQQVAQIQIKSLENIIQNVITIGNNQQLVKQLINGRNNSLYCAKHPMLWTLTQSLQLHMFFKYGLNVSTFNPAAFYCNRDEEKIVNCLVENCGPCSQPFFKKHPCDMEGRTCLKIFF